VSVKHLLDLRFSDCANFLLHHPAFLENQQCRDAANLVTAGRLNIRVHIYFADLDSASIFRSDLIDRRTHLSTRAAPFCPEVNQNRLRRLQHFLIKSSICKN
jgi:hypothetical protein